MEIVSLLKKEAFRFPLSAACGYALGKLVNANPYITAGAVVVSCFATSLFQKLFVSELNKNGSYYILDEEERTKNEQTKNKYKFLGSMLIKSIVPIGISLILQARVIKSAPAFYAFPILISFDIATTIIAKPISKYFKNESAYEKF